jgi:hypothetical protein
MDYKWPFFVGTGFLLIILAIAFFGDDPTPAQFMIYRIVIALAGAAFAVALSGTLSVNFPLFQRGEVKATAAFAVFVILYFFTPASLAVSDAEIESRLLLEEYYGGSEALANSKRSVSSIWAPGTRGYELFAATPEFPDSDHLESVQTYIDQSMTNPDYYQEFVAVANYFDRVFTCVESGSCDSRILCEGMFEEVESFRNTYCGTLIDLSDSLGRDIWAGFQSFSERTCRRDFLDLYVRYDNPEDLENVCLPVQCWAKHTARPFPCEQRTQLVGASAFGATLLRE